MRKLLYIVCLLIVTGCSAGSPFSRSLDEADSLMQSDPSAAMDKLNSLDIASFDDSATMARWALLYSEALVANRLTAPTDTIVNIAVDYYGRHNLREEFRHASRLKALLLNSGESDKLGEALYLQKEKEFFLYQERMRREQIILAGVLILVIASGIIMWQRQRIKLREAENESLMAEASALMTGLSYNKTLCLELRSKLKNLLDSRFDVIDQLCETYFETQGTKTERKALVEKVKSQIEELRSDSGLFAEMERSVNDCCDGLLDHLREEWPTIKPDDYRLTVYLACNLSNRSIAALTGETMTVVYKRKSRLKARLSSLESPYKARFMAIF